LRYRRSLLTYRYIYADYVLTLLIDDRIYSDCGFPCLAITDYQLALSPTNRHHRINCFESSLQRFFNGLPINNARRDAFNRIVGIRDDWTTIVNWIA
jgi:hypothetical protein